MLFPEEMSTSAIVISLIVSRFGAFRAGDTLIALGAGDEAHFIKAKYDGLLLRWKVGLGYRVTQDDVLGEVLYFHPNKPAYLSFACHDWFHADSETERETVPKSGPIASSPSIDLSDKIFDREEPKAKEKSDGRKKKRNNKKKRATINRKKQQQKTKEDVRTGDKPPPSPKPSDDEHEQASTAPLSTIMYRGNRRQVVIVGPDTHPHPAKSNPPSTIQSQASGERQRNPPNLSSPRSLFSPPNPSKDTRLKRTAQGTITILPSHP